MTNINDIDLDLLEKLSLTKKFNELNQEEKQQVLRMVDEAEYNVMYELHRRMKEVRPDEITPTSMLKNKLDKSWETKKRRNGFIHLHLPVYQSAVAAIIFFFAGMGMNRLFEKPTPIASNTIEVVKYVDRPVKQIQYVTIEEKKRHQSSQPQAQAAPKDDEIIKKPAIPEINSDINAQQTMALANIDRLANDTNGMSMEEDTILRKMMVTMN